MNRDADFLLDILELVDTVGRHRAESEGDFLADEVLLTATIHWVQTIGEAANAVSEATRRRFTDIPWRQVIDMRNLLAHGYRHVAPSIVWQVVVRDLPVLGDQVRKALADLTSGE